MIDRPPTENLFFMDNPPVNEERVQALADIFSLVALIGSIDKAAVQRVLLSLGNTLAGVKTKAAVDRELARKILVEIAKEGDEQKAIQIAGDINLVARAWKPVLDEYLGVDAHRKLPFAEIIYALVNYSGVALQDHEAFERFGGPDVVLPMTQLTAALKIYKVPKPLLEWQLVGFRDPPDQALIASDPENIYLFKAASAPTELRFSELERAAEGDARHEHDVKVDEPLFAAFIAGLLGDMLYWSARLRSHALPGHEIWQRLNVLLAGPEADILDKADQMDKT